jgi:peptide deformylase
MGHSTAGADRPRQRRRICAEALASSNGITPHIWARMAILKIARLGHPVLARRADPVADPTAPEVRRLAEDMIATMEDAEGAGLAAPQVHVPLRLFVFRVAPGRDADGRVIPTTVAINPQIEPLGDEVALAWEGCLSIPGLRGAVPRAARILWRAVDLDGRPIGGEAGGFEARVIQHEHDHLDGIVYPMRMTDFRLFGFTEEVARAAAEREEEAAAEREDEAAAERQKERAREEQQP